MLKRFLKTTKGKVTAICSGVALVAVVAVVAVMLILNYNKYNRSEKQWSGIQRTASF